MDDTTQIIGQLRASAADQAYFSASRVQSSLFDLYGAVTVDDAKRLIETWLTLTIQRDLFSSAELVELLDDLEGRLTSSIPG